MDTQPADNLVSGHRLRGGIDAGQGRVATRFAACGELTLSNARTVPDILGPTLFERTPGVQIDLDRGGGPALGQATAVEWFAAGRNALRRMTVRLDTNRPD